MSDIVKVEQIHPVLFGVYQPTALIKSKGREDFTLIQFKVYHEILSFNHKREPGRLWYDIPIKFVTQNKNYLKMVEDIRISLQSTSFLLPPKYHHLLGLNGTSDRAIAPFPTIDFDRNSKSFQIELHRDFKKILLEDNSFSKGDIGTLRSFSHIGSNLFYWQIRQKQVWGYTWETTFDQLREELGFVGKYQQFKEFKRWVLEPAKKELADTWCAFDYEAPPSGKGGKITKMKLTFKNGPKEEKSSPVGLDRTNFPWENSLKNMGFHDKQILMIRQYVSAQSSYEVEGKLIIWDSHYVTSSIAAAAKQFKAQEKSKNPVINKVAWLFEGLISGHWNDQVEAERIALRNAVQTVLDFKN